MQQDEMTLNQKIDRYVFCRNYATEQKKLGEEIKAGLEKMGVKEIKTQKGNVARLQPSGGGSVKTWLLTKFVKLCPKALLDVLAPRKIDGNAIEQYLKDHPQDENQKAFKAFTMEPVKATERLQVESTEPETKP